MLARDDRCRGPWYGRREGRCRREGTRGCGHRLGEALLLR